jgi:hypothetical protein
MNKNVGLADRFLRIFLGLGLVGATIAGVVGPWGWLGVVPIITGIVGFCPAYPLFGVSTCMKK